MPDGPKALGREGEPVRGGVDATASCEEACCCCLVEQRCCCGHTFWRWFMFVLEMNPLTMVTFGTLGWDHCPGIPHLPFQLVTMGSLCIFNATLDFVSPGPANKQPARIRLVKALTGLCLVGLIVWGASMSLPEHRRWARPHDDAEPTSTNNITGGVNGPDYCAPSVFQTGFISSTVALCVLCVIIVQKAKLCVSSAKPEVGGGVLGSPTHPSYRTLPGGIMKHKHTPTIERTDAQRTEAHFQAIGWADALHGPTLQE